MKKIAGVGFIGFLFVVFLVVFFGLLVVKLAPPYMNHYEIRQIMEGLVKEPDVTTLGKARIKELFARRLNMNSINIPDLVFDIKKEKDKLFIVVKYQVKTHMVYNIDALLTFDDQVVVE